MTAKSAVQSIEMAISRLFLLLHSGNEIQDRISNHSNHTNHSMFHSPFIASTYMIEQPVILGHNHNNLLYQLTLVILSLFQQNA
jgi:hypothetical protein